MDSFDDRGDNRLGSKGNTINGLSPKMPIDDFPHGVDDGYAATVE